MRAHNLYETFIWVLQHWYCPPDDPFHLFSPDEWTQQSPTQMIWVLQLWYCPPDDPLHLFSPNEWTQQTPTQMRA